MPRKRPRSKNTKRSIMLRKLTRRLKRKGIGVGVGSIVRGDLPSK